MKTQLYTALLLMSLSLLCCSASPQSQPTNGLALRILNISNEGEITIDIRNTSTEPLRIWKDSNSWGAGRWRILIVRGERLQTFFQNPAQSFTVNMPTFHEVPPGSHLEQKLNPNERNWCSLGFCFTES